MVPKEDSPAHSTIKTGELDGLVNVTDVHINVDQALIITTEDKLRINLNEHVNNMERSKSWIAPLGILTTIIIALITTDIKKDVFLFSPDTWQAIFIICAIISFFWLVITIRNAWKCENIDDLIKRLKTGSR